MAISCVALLSSAAVIVSYHFMHPLVGCQDVVQCALIRDTLPVMDSGDARDSEHIYEPHNRTMHAAAQHYPEPIHMESLESAIRSFAD
eukprot:1685667-Amphidinium_carterae.1